MKEIILKKKELRWLRNSTESSGCVEINKWSKEYIWKDYWDLKKKYK